MKAAAGVPATGLQATRETMSARRSANAADMLENIILGRRAAWVLLDFFCAKAYVNCK